MQHLVNMLIFQNLRQICIFRKNCLILVKFWRLVWGHAFNIFELILTRGGGLVTSIIKGVEFNTGHCNLLKAD